MIADLSLRAGSQRALIDSNHSVVSSPNLTPVTQLSQDNGGLSNLRDPLLCFLIKSWHKLEPCTPEVIENM